MVTRIRELENENAELRGPARRDPLPCDELRARRARSATRARLHIRRYKPPARARTLQCARDFGTVPEGFDEAVYLSGLRADLPTGPSACDPASIRFIAEEPLAVPDASDRPFANIAWFIRRLAYLGRGLSDVERRLVDGLVGDVEDQQLDRRRLELPPMFMACYPTGQPAITSSQQACFPNGRPVFGSNGELFYPDGLCARGQTRGLGTLLGGLWYPDGAPARRWGHRWHTPSGYVLSAQQMWMVMGNATGAAWPILRDGINQLFGRHKAAADLAVVEIAWRWRL